MSATAGTETRVALDVDAGVATIRLTNPAGRNAVDAQMAAELLEAVRLADADPGVRVILTVAEGKAWCAGGDVVAFQQQGEGLHEYIRAVGADVSAIAATLHESDKIAVAGVHGAVVGGGLGLMAAHDVVVAAAGTRISFAYGALGLTPDLGGTYFVVRDIGYRQALDLYLTNRTVEAAEARAIGLVEHVVDDDEIRDAAAETARRLAAGPVAAFGQAKRLMRQAADALLARQLDDEIRTLADATRGAEFREGLAAFAERRPPDFAG
jgi:2-(1,2-epoxy-1,2-dihydrophenyl)acetyl-CoA isomerase